MGSYFRRSHFFTTVNNTIILFTTVNNTITFSTTANNTITFFTTVNNTIAFFTAADNTITFFTPEWKTWLLHRYAAALSELFPFENKSEQKWNVNQFWFPVAHRITCNPKDRWKPKPSCTRQQRKTTDFNFLLTSELFTVFKRWAHCTIGVNVSWKLTAHLGWPKL